MKRSPKKKKCSRCAKNKDFSAFNNNRSKKDGKDSECRSCKNPRDRRNNHKWRKNNPEKEAARAIKSNMTRAVRLKNAKGGRYDPGRADYRMRLLLFGGLCAYCRKKPATTYDHGKAIAKGGSNHASNIYPACRRCNLEKGVKTLWKEYIPRCARGVVSKQVVGC